jgi:hypothetical protein
MLIGECQDSLRLKCGQLGNTISNASRKAITRALVWKDFNPQSTAGTARKQVALAHADNGPLKFSARIASNTENTTAGIQSRMHRTHATLIAVRVELNCVTPRSIDAAFIALQSICDEEFLIIDCVTTSRLPPSRRIAAWYRLSADFNAKASDNYFDLLPGETAEIVATSAAR